MGTRRHRRRGVQGLLGLFFIAVLGLSTPALTLEPDRRLSQYNHEVWRSENGLPQNSVLSGVQTSDGYLWFGTYEGLARFDGARFTIFDRRTSPELEEQEITSLVVDASGLLWVGTRRGAYFYESGQLRRPAEIGELAEAYVWSLAVDSKSIWMSTSKGLARAPVSGKGPWRRYTTQDGMPEGGSRVVTPDGAGGAWVGTRQGLARVSGDKVEMIPLPDGVPHRILALKTTRDGTLWVGTSEGLLSLREGLFTTHLPTQGLPAVEVTKLLEDRDGNLWVGTERGLLRHNAAGFSAFSAPKDLVEGKVSCLLEDQEGRLWVGLWGAGLHRLSNGPFVPFGEPEGFTLGSATMVLESHDGTLWLGQQERGLERVKDGVVTRMGPAQGLTDERVLSLAEVSDGTLWVGTRSGAYRYDGQRFVLLAPEAGMPPKTNIWAMVAEPGGGMWFATSAGLAWLNGGRVTLYANDDGHLPNHVRSMQRESSGALWLSSHEGLYRFFQGTFTAFTSKDGLSSDNVYTLHIDAQGTLWAGTAGGVTRLKDGRFASITSAQGLPDDTVYTFLPDSEGFFWMSSNKGVARVSRRELEEVADGKRQRVHGAFFDERDGMRVGECNGGQPPGWKTRDGRMWFANLRGAVMVNPKDVRLQTALPRVRIEDVRVHGQPVPLTERLELAPGQRDLDIRFTAFVADGAPRVPFRYRLEGHDSGWVDAEGRRVATYTRLRPGTYQFQVQAQDRAGNWLEPGAVLEVKLQPWFYQAAWFYVLCALGVGGVAVGAYAWRVGRLKQRERWLQARVEERTQELARANEELDANLRTLRATQAQLVQAGKMAAVGTLAAGVGHEINNPLSYIISNLEHSCEEAEALERIAESSEPLRERLRDMQQVLREALMGADRVRRIVRDLKTFSRQDEDARGPVDLRAVMDSAAKMAAGELRPRAQLVRDYASDVPQVEGNEARLAQVFLNLLINAAQALPEGKCEQNEVRLVLKHGGADQVVAEVRDTGSGIPPEVIGRIFDPFFTTKPVGVGTGLGLALCQAFVASMGGRIEVESQIGKGSVFRVTLPVASGQQKRVSRSMAAVASSTARGRVLVVDDDPLVSSALRRTLAREHEVEVVVSSRRALEMLTSPGGGFDVILCDLMMPEMTGMELHAQLAMASPEQPRRMVFITGGAYTPAAREFLEQVSNPRVEKPFDPEALREQVSEWVKQARPRVSDQAA
jgi:signal transduction histidine kinase/ligand-binding sensor domain-containing protein/CheY-like chemotaxis protein